MSCEHILSDLFFPQYTGLFYDLYQSNHIILFSVCSLSSDDTRLRFSSGRVAVTLSSLLDDQHWHSVLIERFNKQVNLTVDTHTQHFRTKGEGDSLEVDYEVGLSKHLTVE